MNNIIKITSLVEYIYVINRLIELRGKEINGTYGLRYMINKIEI